MTRPAIAQRTIWGAAILCLALWAPRVGAYPMYDDGFGNGCVSCHNGFLGGNGPLHLQHRNNFAVTTCNLCHPNGGGTTPVLTYFSGPGGGRGCAGCHGQDYGETSPNSGQPKSTSYGLRLFHANHGVTVCATCHQPGTLGSPNPYPTFFGENVAPVYYAPAYSNLTDPCSSAQEDLPFDADSVGLDNDGDGAADYPADSDCAPPTTSTTTTTLPFACGAAPASCVASGKGKLLVDERHAGKEKLKVSLTKLVPAVTQSEFGNPVSGTTSYKVCVYDAANALRGEYTVARAIQSCGSKPCWSAIKTTGYKYGDKAGTASGIVAITANGGLAGKGKVVASGNNKTSTLPTGVALLLQNQSSATVQVLTSDASCFGVGLTLVKKADGTIFSAGGP